MENDFLKFLQSKCIEGETILIVKQSSSGAWPSFMPDKWRPNQPWFGNTAMFIKDRMTDRISASVANCDCVGFLLLDDVGTKCPEPPLEPTWKMETSPGNYQWVYAFAVETQPLKGEYSAAIKAIADAGFTDAGAINPVRNFRLPGSINKKPGRDNFASVLAEFHPEREFTLKQICDALQVVPSEADTAAMRTVALTDDGKDDVLAWIVDRHDLLERRNSQGWYGVVCPNSESHSDGNLMGRYHPVNRAYTCFHGHCVGVWDSKKYLEWVQEQGGPSHQPGLRDTLLTEVMSKALAVLKPTDMFSDDSFLASTEKKELARVEKAGWHERYAYIQNDDSYFDLESRREITRSTFNAMYRHVFCKSIHGRPRVEASISFDQNREANGAQAFVGITYSPGDPVAVLRDGLLYGNKWCDSRPTTIEGDISRWMDHVKHMIPEAFERNHVLDVLAYKLQNPTRKINHAVLHAGAPGSGKDTLYAPFLWAIGGANVKLVRNETLTSQWGYDLESEVMVINELRQAEAKDRRALENTLKPVIAAPPDMLPINRKGLHPYMAINRVFVLAFSNERAAISIPSDDRRWFCVWSATPRMEDAEIMWAWYHGGGFAAVAHWLSQRDVSAFNPSATPPMTEAKAVMVERGRSGMEEYIIDQLTQRAGPFVSGVVAAPFHSICDKLSLTGNMKIAPVALFHAFTEAGWVDCGRLKSRRFDVKKQVFCAPEFAALRKSDLRDMAEPIRTGGNIAALIKKPAEVAGVKDNGNLVTTGPRLRPGQV